MEKIKKEIGGLPKIYREIYSAFLLKIEKERPEEARELLRPLLDFYTLNEWEVPEDLEVSYAKLFTLEMGKELKSE